MTTKLRSRTCTIVGAGGEVETLALPAREHELYASAADRASVRGVMSRDLICARPDVDLATTLALLLRHKIGCMPIVDQDRRPIGILTKLDLCEEIAGLGRVAEDVRITNLVTTEEHVTIAYAADLMVKHDTHHVLVVGSNGALVGVVSTKDIVTWVVERGALTERPSREAPAWHPLEG
jgi:CBS domain-containing protein